MGLRSDYFNVMYRVSNGKSLPEDISLLSEFKLIKNPSFHWVADPFPVVVDGRRYIFVEIMSRVSGKAAIGYICIDDKKPKWRKCFNPPFHISFPNIFVEEGNVLAMPETYQDHCLARYSVSKGGFSWKKKEVVLPLPYCVDSCFDRDDKTILLTYENDGHNSKNPNTLVVRDYKNPETILFSVVDEGNKLRPAGNCFLMDGFMVLPSQDCSSIYGGGIIFNRIELEGKTITPMGLCIYPSDIRENSSYKKAGGCHTYNRCGDLETIDVLLPKFAIRGLLHKIKAALRSKGR